MLRVVGLGLLEAFLLLLAGLLLALTGDVVGIGVIARLPTEQAQRTHEQTAEGTAAGPRIGEASGESIEPVSVHAGVLPNRLRTAVEAKRQGGAESPSSVVVLLGCSLHRAVPRTS